MRAERPDSSAVIAAVAPDAAYYRAFKSYGWEMVEEPVVGGTQADAFFCVPDGALRDAGGASHQRCEAAADLAGRR